MRVLWMEMMQDGLRVLGDGTKRPGFLVTGLDGNVILFTTDDPASNLGVEFVEAVVQFTCGGVEVRGRTISGDIRWFRAEPNPERWSKPPDPADWWKQE